jgi:hypothetical protein
MPAQRSPLRLSVTGTGTGSVRNEPSASLACQTRHFLAANSRFATAAVPKKANKATKTEAGMIVWFVGVLEMVMFKSDAATRMTASHIIPMASVPHISGIRI